MSTVVRTLNRIPAVVVLMLLAGCGGDDNPAGPGALPPQGEDFAWSGTVALGNTVEIKGVNGGIDASGTSGGAVQVTALKTAAQSNPSSVRIDVVEHSGGVTICAVYPDVSGQPPNSCQPGNQGNVNVQNNDVQVNFTVGVPAGVVFVGRTVNGGVSAQSMLGDAFGYTVNGGVSVSTTGLGEAATVNGGIDATIGSTDWGRDLAFTAVNGGVTVEVPSATNAEVLLNTLSGTVTSEFPLTEVSPNRLTGTIGSGGPLLTVSTVNGGVTLRRGS